MDVARFQLHLVTERLIRPGSSLPRIAAAVAGGVDWVQLRDRSAAAVELYDWACAVQAILASRRGGPRAALSVNDRLDVALAVGADGVHLAGRSLPVAVARRLAGGRVLVGRSVHSVEEARQAAADGAQYLTFGHVYPSSSKEGLAPRGTAQLAAVVAAVDVPVLAIGGITAANLAEVLDTGCAGIAVISAILSAADPERAARGLRDAMDASRSTPRRPFRPTDARVSAA